MSFELLVGEKPTNCIFRCVLLHRLILLGHFLMSDCYLKIYRLHTSISAPDPSKKGPWLTYHDAINHSLEFHEIY